MKKLHVKKLVLKTTSLGELAKVSGAADSAIIDQCISKVIITVGSAILNCYTFQCPTPSDANGNCRTYTPSRYNC